ncbi:hypothetical protein UR09_06530 [Candidatus Nitromaritima sp. SCGC AAA799-A02]|nr:hypothetical protein UR09_06530 [Candidatus Nitromaritima sp. SCGC AAA799-A02]
MSQIKDDLICEIIRVSQTNLLAKKKNQSHRESGEEVVLDWIRCNAASYRADFKVCLEPYSTGELGDMLSELTQSQKDLSDILKNHPLQPSQSKSPN